MTRRTFTSTSRRQRTGPRAELGVDGVRIQRAGATTDGRRSIWRDRALRVLGGGRVLARSLRAAIFPFTFDRHKPLSRRG